MERAAQSTQFSLSRLLCLKLHSLSLVAHARVYSCTLISFLLIYIQPILYTPLLEKFSAYNTVFFFFFAHLVTFIHVFSCARLANVTLFSFIFLFLRTSIIFILFASLLICIRSKKYIREKKLVHNPWSNNNLRQLALALLLPFGNISLKNVRKSECSTERENKS